MLIVDNIDLITILKDYKRTTLMSHYVNFQLAVGARKVTAEPTFIRSYVCIKSTDKSSHHVRHCL